MRYFPAAGALSVILLLGGCATKTYVRKTTDPINQRVDEQKQALNQTNDSLQKTQQTVSANETALKATDERARSAGTRADDAMKSAGEANTHAVEANNHAVEAAGKADAANQEATKANQGVDTLRSQVAGLDDYKEVAKGSVTFKFNSDKLDDDAHQQLDQLAQNYNKYKRYFIAVEGFTDRSGDDQYNKALSQRRADAVVTYLVTQHEIPVYRIQMLGLGKANPVDDGHTREANAKNRRVEVTIYSSDGTGSPVARN